jgi:hypothetical protein
MRLVVYFNFGINSLVSKKITIKIKSSNEEMSRILQGLKDTNTLCKKLNPKQCNAPKNL